MRSLPVVVLHELTEDGREVLLVQNDDVVEALSPQGADHSLRNSVRFGALIGVAMASMPMRRARLRKSRP